MYYIILNYIIYLSLTLAFGSLVKNHEDNKKIIIVQLCFLKKLEFSVLTRVFSVF